MHKTLMNDKRKNIRISHEDKVKFSSGEKIFPGKLVNISRQGMQVRVSVPESYNEVRSITFSLPKSKQPLQIPCKLIRVKKNPDNYKEHIVGIEFSYKAQAQMILIDNFIKEMKKSQLIKGGKSDEMRQIPRAMCLLTGVQCDAKDAEVLSIDNISTEGFLMSFEGELHFGDSVGFTFNLPDDPRTLKLTGVVMYIVENYFGSANMAGISFAEIAELDRIKLRNFIVESSSSSALKNLQETFSENGLDEEYQVTEIRRINHIFSFLKEESIHVNVLFENNVKMFELEVLKFSPEGRVFMTSVQNEIVQLGLKKPNTAYFSFYMHGGSYYFKSELLEFYPNQMVFTYPRILYQSEKRSYQRKFLGETIELSFEHNEETLKYIQGKLIDISRRGFLCEVSVDSTMLKNLKHGGRINYTINTALGLDEHGEIRHVKEVITADGSSKLRIGVEAGIKRARYSFNKFSPGVWDKHKLFCKKPAPAALDRLKSTIVTYQNIEGNKITAIINATRKNIHAPVVILPPAFGKKKEALSPLSSTLIANFKHFKKPMVTIRYDGINRPGESYNEEMCPKRGYEMLHYRISQGFDDLQSTITYVYNNPYFKPSKVIIVAFSMSALDARKLTMIEKENKVDYLINVMGVSSGQSAFSNITGGLDIIGNYKMGILNGVAGIMGHILDLDNLARDLVDHKYAYLTDARYDMSRISIPITWIYGIYDKWVETQGIKDIMSIKSEGVRELIEIPTGHNLRSSEDAVKTFKLITSLIYKQVYNKTIRPIDPDRDNMVKLVTYERERLTELEDFKPEDYWKQYLIGTGTNSFGYDFYKNIKEFRDFLSLESRLINIKNGERVADMGCGTGIFFENLIRGFGQKRKNVKKTEFVLIDLIQEALDKAQSKYNKLNEKYSKLLPEKITLCKMNLDPNRLIPVKYFISNSTCNFDYLRGRIEGFKNTTVDNLLKKSTRRLCEIMRGLTPSDEDHQFIKDNFTKEDYAVILDFNRAARFLKDSLLPEDLILGGLAQVQENSHTDYNKVRTTDLIFEKLNFGDNSRNLNLNFEDNYFDKIVASLFVSYLFNPDDMINDFYRMLKPGGKLIVSSMKPDSDISLIFTNYIDKVQHFKLDDIEIKNRDINLTAARAMLNEAASLFELEEDGYFKFYNGDELFHMLKSAGFKHIKVTSSLGKPAQAVIVTGIK
ncbi:MAG: PilZ domain-containing protein [bacterium]